MSQSLGSVSFRGPARSTICLYFFDYSIFCQNAVPPKKSRKQRLNTKTTLLETPDSPNDTERKERDGTALLHLGLFFGTEQHFGKKTSTSAVLSRKPIFSMQKFCVVPVFGLLCYSEGREVPKDCCLVMP